LLSLTAALVSNHTYLSRGILGKKRLNLGVILSGRSTIRKSSALSFMQRFAEEMPLNYGPTDTGNARYGIMSKMQTRWQDDIRDNAETPPIDSLELLGGSNFDSIISKLKRPRTRPSSLYFVSTELGRLLTAQTRELLDFFNDGLDNYPIDYRTKTGNIRIPDPLINLVGATTPGNLPAILPRDAYDHGLLSRLIFVYASRSEASVASPPELTESEAQLTAIFQDRMMAVTHEAEGEIRLSAEAEAEYKRLYTYAVPTYEFRLNAYTGRRGEHLLKVAALICLLRAESPYEVNFQDMTLAHVIMMLTETHMDGAYSGLDRSPDGRAYAIVREAIESFDDKNSLDIQSIMAVLIRYGFNDEDVPKIIARLIKSRRLISTDAGKNLSLTEAVGEEVAATYLNKLYDRLNQSGE